MLHNFIAEHRDQITDRANVLCRARDPQRRETDPTEEVSAFLTQVSTSLRQGKAASSHNAAAITTTAGRNGANMMRAGHSVLEVVQTYGDLCQAVTALAHERHVAISAADFHVFNRCLDDAIGQAVSEYVRLTEEAQSAAEVKRLGYAAHELRDQLQTAQMSLQTLKSSPLEAAPVQLLARALGNLGTLIERTLSDVRLAAGVERREPVLLAPFLEELATTARLHAQSRGLVFTLEWPAGADAASTVEADPHQLMSAVMNLVHNALKFSKPGSHVRLTVRVTSGRLSMAIEDQCGGLPEGDRRLFSSFTDRRGADRTGLGLGLSMAKAIIRSHAGDIEVRNVTGVGCVFTIDMPLTVMPRTTPRLQTR